MTATPALPANLTEILDLDRKITERIEMWEDKREQRRHLLRLLAIEWINTYGSVGPGKKQHIGNCTACHLDGDIDLVKANDYPHRPLADQDCLCFSAACSYGCAPGPVWVPVAWIERRLRETTP